MSTGLFLKKSDGTWSYPGTLRPWVRRYTGASATWAQAKRIYVVDHQTFNPDTGALISTTWKQISDWVPPSGSVAGANCTMLGPDLVIGLVGERFRMQATWQAEGNYPPYNSWYINIRFYRQANSTGSYVIQQGFSYPASGGTTLQRSNYNYLDGDSARCIIRFENTLTGGTPAYGTESVFDFGPL